MKEQENYQHGKLEFQMYTEMQQRYSNKVESYIRNAENVINLNARLGKI